MIEFIALRYHCTPEQAGREAARVMRHLAILREAGFFDG